ncbi:MipA/OmpV family protein [Massilia sp. SR12]
MRAARILLPVLLAVAGRVNAQSAVTLMPEGSSEGRFGLLYGEAWKEQGSGKRQASLYPWFSMAWSNGLFVEGMSAGWKLSEDQHFQYGPMFSFSNRAQGRGGTQPMPGAFLQWRVLHDVELVALTSVGARDGDVKAELALNWMHAIDADHTLVLQAASAKDELRSNRLGAHWSWRLGRRHTLMTSVSGTRLAGGSARAPQVERRSSVAWSAGLLYSF